MKSEIESQDSNDKMKSPETEISKNRRQCIRQRRDSTISFRVSKSLRERIESLAEECGMSLSSYVLSRSSGYEPKPRLTHEENLILDELLRNRSDYVRYASMLNSMSQEQRRNLFRANAWMRGALERLAKAANGIMHIINKYFSANKVPVQKQSNANTTNRMNKQ